MFNFITDFLRRTVIAISRLSSEFMVAFINFISS